MIITEIRYFHLKTNNDFVQHTNYIKDFKIIDNYQYFT